MRASNLPEPEPTQDNFAAICKECGTGTLNNSRLPRFAILDGCDEFEDQTFIVCKTCGSTHVDVVEL
jgi:hypothetical protein